MRTSRTVILAATLLLAAWANELAAGATRVVDTGGEPPNPFSVTCTVGHCTLREAIAASASGDTIRFANSVDGQTIALTLYSNNLSSGSTEFGPSAFFITGNKTLTIDGVTGLALGITIARSSAGGTAKFRLFDVGSGSSLTISGLTLSNGYAKGGDALGTTYSGGGALGAGGAIFSQGTLTIDRCTFSGNTAQGGNVLGGSGMYNGGGGVGQNSPTDGFDNGGGPNYGAGAAGAVPQSGGAGGFGGGGGGSEHLLGGNGGFGGGGGSGPFSGGFGGFGGGGGGGPSGGPGGFGGGTAFGATVYGGAGAGMGGAIFNYAGTVTITNSTFGSNTAQGGTPVAMNGPGAGFGGALFNYNGTLSLNFVTVAGNQTMASGPSDGGAIYSHGDAGGALILQNSIAAYTNSYDVVVDGTSSVNGLGNIVGSTLDYGIATSGPDPVLSFGSNGGLTKTFLPALFPVRSPAIDAVTGGCGAQIDQRGVRRPEGTACDIGAVEVVIPCHVKADATGANTGETWTDAFTNLQSAFGASVSECSEVWVAAGTYKPSTSNVRNATFLVDHSVSQKVYGGFAGGELNAAERAPTLNRTILSGDIGTAGDNSDNSYHVLTFNSNLGVVDGNTVIDGFIITGGNANGGGPDNNGGALYCIGSGNGHRCSPMLSNIAFVDNHAAAGGGAMYNDGSSGGISSPTLSAVTFSHNSADGAGGGLYNYASGGTSSPTLANVTFSDNSSVFGGGMISNANIAGSSSSPSLTNVTFSGNHSSGGGAFNGYGCDSAPGISQATLTNVILWGDTGPSGLEELDFACYVPSYKNSVIQGSGGSGAWNAAFGIDGGGNLDADPLLGALQYNGGVAVAQTLMPAPKGSAIDTGNDANCASNDERGFARPSGFHCDIGAIERINPEDNIFNNSFNFY